MRFIRPRVRGKRSKCLLSAELATVRTLVCGTCENCRNLTDRVKCSGLNDSEFVYFSGKRTILINAPLNVLHFSMLTCHGCQQLTGNSAALLRCRVAVASHWRRLHSLWPADDDDQLGQTE